MAKMLILRALFTVGENLLQETSGKEYD